MPLRACLSLVALTACSSIGHGHAAAAAARAGRSLAIGDVVANIETDSIEGMRVSFRPPQGKVLLVLVWDTRASRADELAKAAIVLYRRLHRSGLNVVGVCTDSSEDATLRFAERWQIPWAHVMDEGAGKAKLTAALGAGRPPFNFLVDAKGTALALNLEGEQAHATVAKILGVSLEKIPMPEPPKPRSERRRAHIVVGSIAEFKFGSAQERRDAEPCKKNLRRISIALTKYRRDHDDGLPSWPSDLFPTYLQDRSLFLCPKDSEPPEGFERLIDRKMKCTYLYEFAPATQPGQSPRARKIEQLDEWGDKVPVVRCLKHSRPLSLSYGGEIYFSSLGWEDDFPRGHTLSDDDAKVRKVLRELALTLARYQKDRGEVPAELADLHPDYVKDKSLFACPVTGKPFSYQFSASKPCDDETYREWKTRQLKEFGDYVPIIRARGVLPNGNVLNLGYTGEIYESGDAWEDLLR